MNTRTVITTSQRLAPGVAIALLLFAATGLRAADFEKGATRLMRMGRPEPVPEKSDFKPMSCQKCKDVATQVPDWSAKGGQIMMAGGRPTKPVVRHQCEGCATTLEVVGHGKAKTQLAKHTCTSCGSENEGCCSTSKAKPTLTKGMEKAK